jgi:nucleoside-diphosphate-sugar epimerase
MTLMSGFGGGLLLALSAIGLGALGAAIAKLGGSLAVNSSLFRRTCGWKPPFTIEEGLAATVG